MLVMSIDCKSARYHGCNVGKASTLNELVKILHQWGMDDVQARCTIEQYDQVMRLRHKHISLDAPVGRWTASCTPGGW
jgi:hypothetical protein